MANAQFKAEYYSGKDVASAAYLIDASGTQVGTADLSALITANGVTTGQTSPDQVNTMARGVIVVLNMTNAGTGSVTVQIQGKDAASGQYYTLAQGSAATTNGTTFVALYPGATGPAPSGSTMVAGVLPHIWRVVTSANNANATSYTVGASTII